MTSTRETTIANLAAGDVDTRRGNLTFNAPLTLTRVINFPKHTTVHFGNGGMIPAQPSGTAVTVLA